jgi:hypothetical protein
MADILLEKMESKDNREEVSDFLFKNNPEVMLHSSYNSQLFLGEHSKIRNQFHSFIFIWYLILQLFKAYPSLFLSLLLCSNFEALLIRGEIDDRV